MNFKKTSLKIGSIALCASLLAVPFTSNASAATKKTVVDTTKQGTAIAAYYYVNGKKIEIPKEDLVKLTTAGSTYKLPNDPLKPKTKTITTNGVQCIAGYEYDGRLISGNFENKKSGTRYANTTSSNMKKVSQIGSEQTINAGFSASGEFKWGPVKTTVGFDISAGQKWSTTESSEVTIKPGKMGWNDYGSYKESWTGTYYYLTNSCGQTSKVTVSPYGPKYKLAVARESAIPPGVTSASVSK
ncbi:hypothetical protein ACFWM3_00660 [Gottfriedia sp. NPDC058432]|uniref:hypothetical protein n=1 Tax=Gottfriedia sp. NPDC058432 TaxID=3346497 RepID=UPI003662CEC6